MSILYIFIFYLSPTRCTQTFTHWVIPWLDMRNYCFQSVLQTRANCMRDLGMIWFDFYGDVPMTQIALINQPLIDTVDALNANRIANVWMEAHRFESVHWYSCVEYVHGRERKRRRVLHLLSRFLFKLVGRTWTFISTFPTYDSMETSLLVWR